MGKQHNVVIMTAEGTPRVSQMKEWLRKNQSLLPPGIDPTHTTSHQLRGMLKANGWKMIELGDQVLLIQPSPEGEYAYANDLVSQGLIEADDLSEEALEEASELSFSLERDMQTALRSNLDQLQKGLRVVDGGVEVVTEAGRIDILAEDHDGALVVIELKAATAQPEALAQVLAYMTSIADQRKAQVRGILVAKDFHTRLALASQSIPTLSPYRYGFRFSFESAK